MDRTAVDELAFNFLRGVHNFSYSATFDKLKLCHDIFWNNVSICHCKRKMLVL